MAARPPALAQRQQQQQQHRRVLLRIVALSAFLVAAVNIARLHEASNIVFHVPSTPTGAVKAVLRSNTEAVRHLPAACTESSGVLCEQLQQNSGRTGQQGLTEPSAGQGPIAMAGIPMPFAPTPPFAPIGHPQTDEQFNTDEMRQYGTFVLTSLRLRIKQAIDDWRKVPPTDPSRGALWSSCAIVGNSGNLLGSGHGSDIDKHDMVLRINNSPIKGLEKDVGSKTTISLLNGWKMHWCGERERCPCWPYGLGVAILTYVWEPFMREDIAHCRQVQPRAYIAAVDNSIERLANRVATEYTERRLHKLSKQELADELKVRRKVKLNSSTGLLGVVLSFGLCESLSLFGFDRNATQHHFFENRTQHEYLDHDYMSEVDFYKELEAGTAPLRRFYPLPPTRVVV